MGSLKDTFSTVSGWFGDFVSLGLSLAMVFLVVDALLALVQRESWIMWLIL